MEDYQLLIKQVRTLVILIVLLVVAAFVLTISTMNGGENYTKITGDSQVIVEKEKSDLQFWTAPSEETIQSLKGEEKEQILFGRELISKTAFYFGPKGKIKSISNGMNCQNCHLQAGTVPFGNNYGSVYSTYPKYRGRSGTIETIYKRISDCFERSLNGTAPDSNSKEMKAMAAYIMFLGKNVKKGEKVKGTGLVEVKFLDRAANPENGKKVYAVRCQSCHQDNGQGLMNSDGLTYLYPPLWGEHSYNMGAGLYRLSRFAGYVKANMPLGATFKQPVLSDEEAWDLAAFVNSMPRPSKDLSKDWPKIEEKNFDHPFGPFADPFDEKQHKYGPFKPIKDFKDKQKEQKELQKRNKLKKN